MEKNNDEEYLDYFSGLGKRGILISGLMLTIVTGTYATSLKKLEDRAETKQEKERLRLKIEIATELSECAEDFCRMVKEAMEFKDNYEIEKTKAWNEEYNKWLNNA